MPEDYAAIISRLRDSFLTGIPASADWRWQQLRNLERFLTEQSGAIDDALRADLGKPPLESYLGETGSLLQEIGHARRHLKGWMRPRKAWTPLFLLPGRSRVWREPYGVVLIISPWNYPVQLALAPLIAALAAGNRVVLKPSELAPATAQLLHEKLPAYIDAQSLQVVTGDHTVAEALLAEKFDLIFYTGSSRIGKLVMQAAAVNLTPVTLELGGKCPCIVSHDTDLEVAARRLAWGKFLNAGQTCVAPDYVLVHASVYQRFLELLADTITEFYGRHPRKSPDYGRLVNQQHYQRLTGLLQDGRIYSGGEHDAADHYLAPTVMVEIDPQSALVHDEIFGPILPVLPVSSLEGALEYIAARPEPITVYLFSSSAVEQEQVRLGTRSGSLCINETILHLANPRLPFGGLGPSGFGRYHGAAGFETCTFQRSILTRAARPDPGFRYPPYTTTKARWLKRLFRA